MKSNRFSAVDKRLNWAGGLENAYGTGKGHVFFNIKKESMSVNEGMFKKLLQTIHDKLEREGGAAGYDDLAKEVKKEFGLDITKDTLKNMPGVRQHRDGDYILEELDEGMKSTHVVVEPDGNVLGAASDEKGAKDMKVSNLRNVKGAKQT